MGQLIAAVRRAESTAVVVATSKWSAMIGVVSECQSIKLELLAKQRMHRPNSTNRLERSTDDHRQTDANVSEKNREKKKKILAKDSQSPTDFSHVLTYDSEDPGVEPPGDSPAHSLAPFWASITFQQSRRNFTF